MNKRVLLFVSMAAILTLSVVPVIYGAQDKPPAPPAPSAMQSAGSPGCGCMMGGMMAKWHHKFSLKEMLKKLGITNEQKLKMRGFYVAFENNTRKARTELWALRDEKKTMMLSGKIDEAKLASMDDQIVKLVSKVLKAKLKLRRDVLAQLTPEQLGKVADGTAGRMFRHKMMHRFHHGF